MLYLYTTIPESEKPCHVSDEEKIEVVEIIWHVRCVMSSVEWFVETQVEAQFINRRIIAFKQVGDYY